MPEAPPPDERSDTYEPPENPHTLSSRGSKVFVVLAILLALATAYFASAYLISIAEEAQREAPPQQAQEEQIAPPDSLP